MLDEIEKKRAEIEESRALVDAKEEETKKLREEMEAANEQVKVVNFEKSKKLNSSEVLTGDKKLRCSCYEHIFRKLMPR